MALLDVGHQTGAVSSQDLTNLELFTALCTDSACSTDAHTVLLLLAWAISGLRGARRNTRL